MDDLFPKTLRCSINGITLEVCHGEIPDIFRQLRYDPVTEFELPDTKVTEGEFQRWLTLYRHAGHPFERRLLKETQLCLFPPPDLWRILFVTPTFKRDEK